MPIRLCALMSFGDALRISRNRAMPGSICWRRINDNASSYEAGAGGDCAATKNSGVCVSAMMKKVFKKSDLTDSEYQNAEHAERKRGTRGNNRSHEMKTGSCLTHQRVTLFPRVPRFQNSIFNPN